MNETLKKFTGSLHNIWKGMDFSAKLLTSSFLIGTIVGIILWANWIQKEEYGLLFSGKDTREVGEIVNYLRDNNIPYQIKDRGMSLYVPANRIYDTKLNLATEGLLQDKNGFEMFNDVKFGITSFAQKVNFRRALQGELARTISQLEPVETANVQVVIPDESLFIDEKKKPTAAVVLKLKSRRTLSQHQVSGIVQLIASAVEGLDRDDVTITDSTGNLLTIKEASSMISKNSEQLDLRKQIEDYYVSKATEIVSKILGPGRVVVKVSADMEYKDIDEKHLIYDPERKVPQTQRIITRVSGGPSRAGGSPGTDSNIRQVGLVQEIPSSEEEETIQTKYDNSRVERLVSQHGGVLKRLSVAILLDGKYETVEENGEQLRKYFPLPTNTLSNIGALVKNALGIAEERGDSLEVKNLQFSDNEISVAEVMEKQNPYMQILMDNISFIVTIFTFMMFALIVLKKMRTRVHHQVARIEQGLPAEAQSSEKYMTKDKILANKLAKEGIAVGPDGKPIDPKVLAEAEEGAEEFRAERAFQGIKEGMIKSAAMKDLLNKPDNEINKDLAIFKEDIRRQVRTKMDSAANILKRWLSQ